MRAIYYREFFEGNSRKFSKFENENEGKIFESFGIPSYYYRWVGGQITVKNALCNL